MISPLDWMFTKQSNLLYTKHTASGSSKSVISIYLVWFKIHGFIYTNRKKVTNETGATKKLTDRFELSLYNGEKKKCAQICHVPHNKIK